MAELRIEEKVPLASLSTIGVGGPARYYTRVAHADDVTRAADWAASRRQPVLVLGGGSNLIVSDDGFPGLVLHLALRGTEVVEAGGVVELNVAAGESWDELVRLSVERGWAGLECLSGIPGLVGATPIQNVGAYGQEIAETLVSLRAVELSSGRSVTFDRESCRFRYRESRFKTADRGRYVIVDVKYRLQPGAPPAVRYPEIARVLEERGRREPALGDVREAVLAVRRRKSMVLDAADPCSRSVGSFFVNPVVSLAFAQAVEAALQARGRLAPDARMPSHPAGDGRVKLAAAWLIEHCGFERGMRRGAVGLSEKHALALVNYGGAGAADVVAFAREVRDRVRDICGVVLTPEPVFVGLSL
jgi:UDP-N-acetylmuramate dehydrogenase